VRKSFGVALAGAAVLAAAVWLIAFWLPARQASQHRKWDAAGQRALAHVVMPASFRPHDDAGSHYQICDVNLSMRCFVVSGDPRDTVSAAQAAFTSMATQPTHPSCHKDLEPHAPDRCSFQVPVAGSKLLVDLFARGADNGFPGPNWKYDGSYVEVRVDAR
jgi:hypothetical protein